MELAKLRELVSFLRDCGVAMYKDSEVELVFNAAVPTRQAIPLPSGDVTPERKLPEVFSKLPANYSHPSLLGQLKIGS